MSEIADVWFDPARPKDGTLLVAGTPGFHELKGRPHAAPGFS